MPHPKQAANVYVEKLDDELCIYDWEQKQIHALNPTATLVWELCDGQTDPAQMTTRLKNELDVPDADKLVALSLDRLEKACLLDGAGSQTQRAITRREVLKMAGIGLALLPVVSSVALPSPADAQSCNANCNLGGPLGSSGFNNCTDACEDVFQTAPPGIILCSVDQFTQGNEIICQCNYYDPDGCNRNNVVTLGWG